MGVTIRLDNEYIGSELDEETTVLPDIPLLDAGIDWPSARQIGEPALLWITPIRTQRVVQPAKVREKATNSLISVVMK